MFARWTPLEQYLLSKVRGIRLHRPSASRLWKMLKPFTSEWIIPQTLIVSACLGGIQLVSLRRADVFPVDASLPLEGGREATTGNTWSHVTCSCMENVALTYSVGNRRMGSMVRNNWTDSPRSVVRLCREYRLLPTPWLFYAPDMLAYNTNQTNRASQFSHTAAISKWKYLGH